jgi:hypothetical protein
LAERDRGGDGDGDGLRAWSVRDPEGGCLEKGARATCALVGCWVRGQPAVHDGFGEDDAWKDGMPCGRAKLLVHLEA